MNKISKEQQIKQKAIRTNFQMRVISSVFLVIALIVYLTFPILYNIGFINNWSENSLIALNVISLLISSAILFFSTNELLSSFEIKFSKEKLFIQLFTVLLLWIPFTDKDRHIYVFNFISSVNYWNIIPFIILISYISLVWILLKNSLNKNKSEISKILLVSFIMIFALKTFNMLGFYIFSKNRVSSYLLYGFSSIIWIWLTIILTDTFAYLFGVKFGKHKLAPTISPKKSWEGAIAGFVCSVLVNLAIILTLYFVGSTQKYAPFYGYFKILNISNSIPVVLSYIFITMAVSILCQLGDLLFSWIKRSVNIKDFSNLIPGHGGILDRLDSFYFVLCVMFFVIFIGLFINQL